MVRLVIKLAILLPISCFGQLIVNDSLTKNHTRVEDTNIYLSVPTGFVWISRSREFINSKIGASIIINYFEDSIDQLRKVMSKDILFSQGSILISETPARVNNQIGYLIKARRQTFKEKVLSHTLIFGFDRASYSVQIIFPESDKQFEKQSIQILGSVVYKDAIPVSNKSYLLDLNRFSFEYLEKKNGVDYYKSIEKNIDLVLTVDEFFTKGNTEPGMIFYNRTQRLPYSAVELGESGMEEITVDGISGLHATFNGVNENGVPIYTYQLLLTDAEKNFLIQATTLSKKNLLIASDLVKTFKKLN